MPKRKARVPVTYVGSCTPSNKKLMEKPANLKMQRGGKGVEFEG